MVHQMNVRILNSEIIMKSDLSLKMHLIQIEKIKTGIMEYILLINIIYELFV